MRRDKFPVSRDDAPWLGAALAAGLLAAAIYLATNPYPAYGAGLYLKIADAIAANGYAPPARIGGYTADGVPFAYPPLQFYVLAVLLDLGVDPVALARFLPSVGVLGALVPVYLLARDYAGSRPAGAAAAVAVALNPQLLQWHVSAGGVVRAFAFCYALIAIYAGYHVFRAGSRRATLAGALAFGLTLLTHPTYSLFVVVTYLLLWGVRDRTLAGLRRGATVGVGGAVVASPWLFWVTATYGADVLTGAAGTHGGHRRRRSDHRLLGHAAAAGGGSLPARGPPGVLPRGVGRRRRTAVRPATVRVHRRERRRRRRGRRYCGADPGARWDRLAPIAGSSRPTRGRRGALSRRRQRRRWRLPHPRDDADE